jgi:hypothetical protein
VNHSLRITQALGQFAGLICIVCLLSVQAFAQGTGGGAGTPGGPLVIPPLPLMPECIRPGSTYCDIYAKLARQAEGQAAKAELAMQRVSGMIAEAAGLEHAADTDESAAANSFKTAAAEDELSQQATDTAAKLSGDAKKSALGDAEKYTARADADRKQGEQAKDRAAQERLKAADLRAQVNSDQGIFDLFDSWTSAAAEARAAYNRCKALPPCEPRGDKPRETPLSADGYPGYFVTEDGYAYQVTKGRDGSRVYVSVPRQEVHDFISAVEGDQEAGSFLVSPDPNKPPEKPRPGTKGTYYTRDGSKYTVTLSGDGTYQISLNSTSTCAPEQVCSAGATPCQSGTGCIATQTTVVSTTGATSSIEPLSTSENSTGTQSTNNIVVATSPAQTPSTSIPISFKGPDGEPLEGKSVALRLGNFKTATVSGPTNSDGKTVVSTGNIPTTGVVVDFYDCHNGIVIGVQQGAARPCPGATLIATGPIAPGTTTGSNFQQVPIGLGNVATLTTISTANGSYENYSLDPNSTRVSNGYDVTLNEDNQTYTVTATGDNGESITITGVLPNDVGLPLQQLMQFYKGSTTVVPIEEPPGATVDNDPQATDSQDGGAGSAMPSSPPAGTTPGTTPHGWVEPGTDGPPRHPHYQTAAFLVPASAEMPPLWKAQSDLSIAAAKSQVKGISYSIIANGNSTGEAFMVVVNDPSGRVKTIPIPPGTALEPTGRRLAKPLPPDSPGTKQPLNSYCLQFHKEPPAPGMLYRIAGPGKQQAYETVRYILAAINRLNMDGKLHPDIEVPEYLDASRQYTSWCLQENWDQKAFTENWIERTKKNAQNLNVKWTKEMEKTLREAAPGRWGDISQVRDLASRSDGAMKQALAAASKREPGKP